MLSEIQICYLYFWHVMLKEVIFIICEFYAYLLQQILGAGDIRRCT